MSSVLTWWSGVVVTPDFISRYSRLRGVAKPQSRASSISVSNRSLDYTGILSLNLLITHYSLLLFFPLIFAVSLQAEPTQFETDCKALSSGAHRLTGTPENQSAAAYVVDRLKALGLAEHSEESKDSSDKIYVQDFASSQTYVNQCEIKFEDGRTYKLLPSRPDGIVPPVTPIEGLQAPLVYLGDATQTDFDKTSPRGKIVVLNYNCNAGWLRAFRLGAAGIIFASNGMDRADNPHHTEANANLPRFYYPGKPADLIGKGAGTIFSKVVWKRVYGRNIFAFIQGSNEGKDSVFHQEKEEVLLIGANLDSFGEVPRKSPAARGAANCAAILHLAEGFLKNRPKRHILLAFWDAGARGHAGSVALYRALYDKKKDNDVYLDLREEYHARETQFLGLLKKLVGMSDPLNSSEVSPVGENDEDGSNARRRLLERAKTKSKDFVDRLNVEMIDLRLLRGTQKENTAKVAAIDKQVHDIQQNKDEWNLVRRYIGQLRRGLQISLDSMIAGYVKTNEANKVNAARQLSDPAVLLKRAQDKVGHIISAVESDIDIRLDELVYEGKALRHDRALQQLLADNWLSLHISLLLGDTTPRYGLLIGGDSQLYSSQDNPGLYGKIQNTFLDGWEQLKDTENFPANFEQNTANGTLNPARLIWAAPFLVHSGEIAGRNGIYNLCIGTSQEALGREGTPSDTLENLNVDVIEGQTKELAHLLSAVASHEGISLKRTIVPDANYWYPEINSLNRPRGPIAMGMLPGSSTPDMPMRGVMIQLYHQYRPNGSRPQLFEPNKIYAFDNFSLLQTNHNGSYGVGPTHKSEWQTRSLALQFDENGLPIASSDDQSRARVFTRLNMFMCTNGVMAIPPQLKPQDTKILDARTNGTLQDNKSFSNTLDGVCHWYAEVKYKSVKVFGVQSVIGLVTGSENFEEASNNIEGDGYATAEVWKMQDTPLRSAVDLWRLNESRLKVMRSREIINGSLEELHGKAEDLMVQATATDSLVEREALLTSAFLVEQPVYHNTRRTLDDLVHAVLVLLGLCVPFAFALERLLMGSTNIYRQIGGFVGFFTITFMLLYFSHPAFAISKTPMIIFLGFSVVVLSSLVIFIIMRKFEVELKVLQGMTSTVHAADVSRISTVIAAMNMGISTMRRRPLRTALTATTILLLTFTILCFASFDRQLGIVRLFANASPVYTGAFVHEVNWSQMPDGILDLIYGRWGKSSAVCPRYWFAPKDAENRQPLITKLDGKDALPLRGILGLDELELKHRPDIANLLGNPDSLSGKIWITIAVGEQFGIKPGESLLMNGKKFQVGPYIDANKFASLQDMDGSSILPVDFSAMEGAMGQQSGNDTRAALAADSQQNWAYLATDTVCVVANSDARNLGANLHGVNLYTKDVRAATQLGEVLAMTLGRPVSATRTGGVYLHAFGDTMSASGTGDLIFPILLGGLVIFGTMLGSVADREKEIYTFSALGLAPPHVASLFFSEALIYSVIGGLGGYLFAQASLQVLTFLADFGLVRVPEVNYSSTNAIVTLLIVMATVLISAIYPALKASRSANPGLLRSWRLPPPDGDTFDIVFPFTVSDYDITGVVSFLKEHFDNHGDAGLGTFMARNATLAEGESHTMGLKSEIALAPFDLGVTQSLALRSSPSEIPGIDEVNIKLTRLSGQPKDWQRLNKVMLDDLRRQFLIWRSLPNETMEIYRERTLVKMGRKKDGVME
ncbi:MAG: FtsX-like permease family protein [Planctomycetota bacterium]|nr:FtsX-like permease family protein [Planctomycetota bacterium]